MEINILDTPYDRLPPYHRYMYLEGYTADEVYWAFRKQMAQQIEDQIKKRTAKAKAEEEAAIPNILFKTEVKIK